MQLSVSLMLLCICTVLVVGLLYLYSNPLIAERKTNSTGTAAYGYLKEENFNQNNLREDKKVPVPWILCLRDL